LRAMLEKLLGFGCVDPASPCLRTCYCSKVFIKLMP
jgi:hypothetical protein